MNTLSKTETATPSQEEAIILLVDDNPTNLGVLADYLEYQGLRILISRDGEGALAKVAHIRPDIILLDVMMPGIDGFETCRRLKASELSRDIPVIFMTALTSTEDKVKGFEAGGLDYVTKPLHQQEVFARVTTHLRIQKLQRDMQRQNDQLRHEISEREKAETELRHAHQEILRLEKDAVERQMAGGFAHEMRNALSGPKMLLDGLMAVAPPLCQQMADGLGTVFDLIAADLSPDTVTQVVDVFRRQEERLAELDRILALSSSAVHRAMQVTTSILDYSRTGRTSTGVAQISLMRVIEAILTDHHQRFREARIEVQQALAETTPLVGDESHFHSIVNNIIQNAYDALTECPPDRVRALRIRLAEDAQRQTIQINDTAQGIRPEHLHKIFDPFFSTKPTKGMGLGLNFVAKLIAMYHGDIHVESMMGVGTCFTVTFPCSPTNTFSNKE